MLVAQVAALGFFVNVFVETVKDPKLRDSWWVVGVLLGLAAAGLATIWLFDRLRRITAWWIDHWLDEIRRLEDVAFGGINLFRNATPPLREGARRQAVHFVRLFTAIWVLLIAVVVGRCVWP
jgi:hypothetical protein